MKRIINILSLSMGASLLFFTGCANPSFNPNSKKIVFVDGKPFRVPVGAGNTPHVYDTSAENKERMSVYNKNGLKCKLGDILWIENYTAREGMKIYEESGKIAGYTYIAQASRQGKSGCTGPISNQEYDFYRSKELDASANARSRANLAAAMTPQTVNHNVNYSGAVNHNISGKIQHEVYTPYQYR